jgi:hypothetical protein
MRADSRRDLYAKALTLVGLSLVAAAGIVVDSWPSPDRVPHVAPALAVPDPIALAQIPVPIPIPVRPSARVARERPARPAVVPAVRRLPVSVAVGAPAAVPLDVPPLVQASAVETAAPPSPSGDAVADLSHPVLPDFTVATLAAPVPEAADEGGNLFTGALKKTGTSIAWTGTSIAKGGASILDAVRAVGGVVRRVF